MRLLLRSIAIFFLVLGLIIFSIYLYRVQRASSRLQAQIRLLRSHNIPVEVSEFTKGPLVADDDNARVWLRRAEPLLQPINKALQDIDVDRPSTDRFTAILCARTPRRLWLH